MGHAFRVSVSSLQLGVFVSELNTNAVAATTKAMGNADLSKVPLYPQYFAGPMERFGALFAQLMATPPSISDAAVMHALTAQFPDTEYHLSSFGEHVLLPCWLLVRLDWLLPRRVSDLIVNTLT